MDKGIKSQVVLEDGQATALISPGVVRLNTRRISGRFVRVPRRGNLGMRPSQSVAVAVDSAQPKLWNSAAERQAILSFAFVQR